MKKIWVQLGIVVLLGSCASAPKIRDVEPGIDLPETWQVPAGATAEIDSSWWQEFGDAQLSEILDVALKQNIDLNIAASRLQIAAAQAKIAGAPLYPQANISFNSRKNKQNFIGFPIPGSNSGVLSTTTNSFGVAMNVSWELDLWGRLRADNAAAVAQLQASQADFIAARLSLTAQVCKTWFAAITAKQQMALSQATVENWQVANEHVQRRYESGLVTSLDYRLSLANFARAKANQRASRSQYEGTLRQLEVLLKRYPSASLGLTEDLPVVSQTIPAGLPADLLVRRPDLAAAERRLAASQSSISSAKRALLPQISLTGSSGTTSKALSDLLSGDFSVWSIAGGLLQPIFQGGKLRANVELAKQQANIATAEYQRAALTAFAEVENALANETHLSESQIAMEEATRQASAARELAETQYARGLVAFVTMLEAQRSAYDNQRQLLEVRRQRLDVRVDLYLALGGGFTLNKKSTTTQTQELHP